MNTTPTRCDHTPAWGTLAQHFEQSACGFDLRVAFAADTGRFSAFSQTAPHVFADLSKNLLDVATQTLLFDLARQSGLEAHRNAMFAGEAINTTEQRAVMHWLLRKPATVPVNQAPVATDIVANELTKVHATLDAM
jgi:glucose-6-phosphate isomerase